MDTLPSASCQCRFLLAHRVPLQRSGRSGIAKCLRQEEMESGDDCLHRVEPLRKEKNGYEAHHGWYVLYQWRRKPLVHFVPPGERGRRNEARTAEKGGGVTGEDGCGTAFRSVAVRPALGCLCRGASPLHLRSVEPVLANLPGELMPFDAEQTCRLALVVKCVFQRPADVLAFRFRDGQPIAIT
jgi:hypothetical protein